jgi:hypothetical protein
MAICPSFVQWSPPAHPALASKGHAQELRDCIAIERPLHLTGGAFPVELGQANRSWVALDSGDLATRLVSFETHVYPLKGTTAASEMLRAGSFKNICKSSLNAIQTLPDKPTKTHRKDWDSWIRLQPALSE